VNAILHRNFEKDGDLPIEPIQLEKEENPIYVCAGCAVKCTQCTFIGSLMSRGMGRHQVALFDVIASNGKPMSFNEIRARILQDVGVNDPTTKLRPTFERSIRRSLHRMVSDSTLIACGGGGRSGSLPLFPESIAGRHHRHQRSLRENV
jgi:hypothetical protein